MTNPPSIRGYTEGYYGRLLAWGERARLLECLGGLSMNAYLLAPKEDPCHRVEWRRDWDAAWWQGFREFTADAGRRGITAIAGLAPGMDFDFTSLDAPRDGTGRGAGDAAALLGKAQALVRAGASHVCLLLDDIDPVAKARLGPFEREGEAHAALANSLAGDLDCPVSVVPRIYADEITDGAEGYLEAFAAGLDGRIPVFTCGSHIIARSVDLSGTAIARAGIDPGRLVLWDNLYANDYCPRRLFLGLWLGREGVGSVMLNPTGLVETDCLLLALTGAGPDRAAWRRVFADHNVPEEFFAVAAFFDLPPDPDLPPGEGIPREGMGSKEADGLLEALDVLLWRWKAPLQREWYPFLKGLRDDILHLVGRKDAPRADTAFPPPLPIPAQQGGKG